MPWYIEKENYKHLTVVAWPLTLRAESISRSAIPYNAPAGAGARVSIPKKVARDEKVNKYAKYVTACGLVPELELLFYISIKLPHSLASS